jgi:hypothetical protein
VLPQDTTSLTTIAPAMASRTMARKMIITHMAVITAIMENMTMVTERTTTIMTNIAPTMDWTMMIIIPTKEDTIPMETKDDILMETLKEPTPVKRTLSIMTIRTFMKWVRKILQDTATRMESRWTITTMIKEVMEKVAKEDMGKQHMVIKVVVAMVPMVKEVTVRDTILITNMGDHNQVSTKT